MAFLKLNNKQTDSEGGSSYISKSGIYDVHLKGIEVGTTTNGATEVNYYFDTLNSFNNIVTNKEGTPTFGMDVISSLGYITGMTDDDVISDPEPTPIKFKNGTKELMCLPEFLDIDVKVRVQFHYKLWKDEIQERVQVVRFYRADDNAAGSEISHKTEIGVRYNKDLPYAEKDKYEDNLTPEKIAKWKKDQADARSGQPAAGGQASSGNAGAAAQFPG